VKVQNSVKTSIFLASGRFRGGKRGANAPPLPLVASNVFITTPSNDYAAVACSNKNHAQLHTHISVLTDLQTFDWA